MYHPRSRHGRVGYPSAVSHLGTTSGPPVEPCTMSASPRLHLCPLSMKVLIARALFVLIMVSTASRRSLHGCVPFVPWPHVLHSVCVCVPESRLRRDALSALYMSAGGAGWAWSTGWMSTASVCGWFGVTCNGGTNGDVVNLTLPQNNLIGTLATEIGYLTSMTSLSSLALNSLSGNGCGCADHHGT